MSSGSQISDIQLEAQYYMSWSELVKAHKELQDDRDASGLSTVDVTDLHKTESSRIFIKVVIIIESIYVYY